jgi:hypothetical protein
MEQVKLREIFVAAAEREREGKKGDTDTTEVIETKLIERVVHSPLLQLLLLSRLSEATNRWKKAATKSDEDADDETARRRRKNEIRFLPPLDQCTNSSALRAFFPLVGISRSGDTANVAQRLTLTTNPL